MFNPALPNIHKEEQPGAADCTEGEEEIKRAAVVPGIINDSAADQRPNERARLSDDREQAKEQEFFASRRYFRNHCLGVGIPRANKQSVENLVHPDFPSLVEPEGLRPDADHAPTVEKDNADGDDGEHGLGGESVVFLDSPEGEDADGLSGDAHDEEVGQLSVGDIVSKLLMSYSNLKDHCEVLHRFSMVQTSGQNRAKGFGCM